MFIYPQMIELSLEIGSVVERLQRERDAVTLYLSDLGPSTRGFLRARFDATDESIVIMRQWPQDIDDIVLDETRSHRTRSELASKCTLTRTLRVALVYLHASARTSMLIGTKIQSKIR